MNVFVVNNMVPKGSIQLKAKGRTIWCGPMYALSREEFERSDESHVCQEDYDRIAAKAEATGKSFGMLQ